MSITPRADAASILKQAEQTVQTEAAKVADTVTNELKTVEGEAEKVIGEVEKLPDALTSTQPQTAEADGILKTEATPNADGTVALGNPPTLPPPNEFAANEEAAAPVAEAPAPAPVMASTGNAGENARLASIQLSTLPVLDQVQDVARLKEGDLFLANFVYAPGTDKEWHATQIIDALKSGRNMLHGLSQAFWTFHYRNRPPIGEKKGNSYVMLD